MVTRFAIKSTILASAIYYSNELEVWGRLSTEPVAYDKAIADAKDYLNQVTPESLQIPKAVASRDLCALTNHYYNCAVLTTCAYLVALPCNLGKLYKSAVDKISQIQ